MSRILITGSASGLGLCMARALRDDGHTVIDYDIKDGRDVREPHDSFIRSLGALDVLINSAGINRIGWLEDVTEGTWDEVLNVNAKGIFMMTKACLPLLAESKGTVLNIVSNASHMPMTCSLAYNASKGAAHVMTLQLARELTRKWGITVFGISPNKLTGTGMSCDIEKQVVATRGWTLGQARDYQLASLLAGSETDPAALAEFVAFLLKSKRNHQYLTGCIIPYGA